MAEPYSGQIVRAGDSPAPRVKVKSGTESVVASTTLQDDNDFVLLPLSANKTYRIEARLAISISAAGTGDFKYAWVFGTGAAQLTPKHHHGPDLGSTTTASTSVNITVSNATTATSYGLDGAGGAASVWCEFMAETTTSGTAGTITLQWAQNTANGTTSMSNASYVIITETELI